MTVEEYLEFLEDFQALFTDRRPGEVVAFRGAGL